ncbi:MAG: hypothetical protein HQK65_14720 [Desulfamplus sp.]|nr:hypothetical protein [Desulfamplus sp.]
MDILACIMRILPDWRGAAWANSYEGIMPDSSETRPIPTMAEIEAAWVEIAAERERSAINAAVVAKLAEIDLKSIRAIREGDRARIDACEAEAAAERLKMRK